ncbi:hypothetical protein [Micromonospora sagamiensis]|uniref:Uncharacterized protein n=1 Tax=Micromonospora sagamiensis TaxID=47875 RepID=A0A562WA17_9ACTN|nr:hypothetical protein [Micromonospora sagamiensis]TWJ26841.1 hypothetical protein JD81_00323 [Micromonospora sagamiensis]
MRRRIVPVVALVLVCVLTACGGSGSGKKKRSRDSRPAAGSSAKKVVTPSTDRDDEARADPTPSPTKTPRRKVRALTCGDLRDAQVGSSTVRYQGYPDHLPLHEGRWSGEDGATVLLQEPCAIGDLDGDGAADAVGAVMLETGGTGRFWSLVVWRNVGGEPRYVTVTDLGDRTPVQSIRITDRKATVVYLTRAADAAMAELNIRRTAVHRLSGSRFPEVSHTDAAA